MTDLTCPGFCNRIPRRRLEDHQRAVAQWQADLQAWVDARARGENAGDAPEKPTEPDTRWVAGTPIWCLSDQAAIRHALTGIDELAALRRMHGDGYESAGAQEPVRGSKDPASPSPAHDELSEALDWLRQYESEYRASQGWPTVPYRGESAPALTASVAWLLSHLDGLLAHPRLSEDFGDGVLFWHRKLDGAAKTKRRRVAKPLRCPQCHLATLSQLEGEDKVECRNRDCGANRGGPVVLSLAEYEALAADLAPTPKQARETFAARREPREPADYGTLSGRA